MVSNSDSLFLVSNSSAQLLAKCGSPDAIDYSIPGPSLLAKLARADGSCNFTTWGNASPILGINTYFTLTLSLAGMIICHGKVHNPLLQGKH